jgi:hypothetical protein
LRQDARAAVSGLDGAERLLQLADFIVLRKF